MDIDNVFLVKRSVDTFYRVPVQGTFATRQAVEEAILAGCVPANVRADMPPEVTHFSAVDEATQKSPKDLELQDTVELSKALEQLLKDLPDADRDKLLEDLKKVKP